MKRTRFSAKGPNPRSPAGAHTGMGGTTSNVRCRPIPPDSTWSGTRLEVGSCIKEVPSRERAANSSGVVSFRRGRVRSPEYAGRSTQYRKLPVYKVLSFPVRGLGTGYSVLDTPPWNVL